MIGDSIKKWWIENKEYEHISYIKEISNVSEEQLKKIKVSLYFTNKFINDLKFIQENYSEAEVLMLIGNIMNNVSEFIKGDKKEFIEFVTSAIKGEPLIDMANNKEKRNYFG